MRLLQRYTFIELNFPVLTWKINDAILKQTWKIRTVSRTSITFLLEHEGRWDDRAENEKFPGVEYFHQESLDPTVVVRY